MSKKNRYKIRVKKKEKTKGDKNQIKKRKDSSILFLEVKKLILTFFG
jgi:hypothetical protein